MSAKSEPIVASVREAVRARRLLPGTQLREVGLPRLYSVSRTIVRQALQRLAKDGLVDLAPGRIASVAKPSARDAAEIFDLRVAIESHVTVVLAERATAADIAQLRAHVAQERAAHAAGNLASVRALGAGFHALLARLAGNDPLAQALEHLHARIAPTRILYRHDCDRHVACLQDEHDTFIDPIEARSAPQAVALLKQHLNPVEQSLNISTTPHEMIDLHRQRALQTAPGAVQPTASGCAAWINRDTSAAAT